MNPWTLNASMRKTTLTMGTGRLSLVMSSNSVIAGSATTSYRSTDLPTSLRSVNRTWKNLSRSVTDVLHFTGKLVRVLVIIPNTLSTLLTLRDTMRHMKAITLSESERLAVQLRVFMRTEHVPAPDGVGGGPCMIYQGNWGDTRGYKKIKWGKETYYVHRLAYASQHGHADGEHVLDHKCRNRGCCNPNHLEPVTVKENTLRGNGKWIFEQGYTPKIKATV